METSAQSDAQATTTPPIVERGVIAQGQRIASAMSDAPRALLARVPLVVLPEIGFAWGDYRPILERFAAERRVFALDWPGFGASAKPTPAEFTYSVANYAELLARWLDSLGIARAALLGNGVGASVAIHYALAQPKRVAALALLGPLGFASTPMRFAGKLANWYFTSPARLARAEVRLISLALGPTDDETLAIEAQRREQQQAPNHLASVIAGAAMFRALAERPSELPELREQARQLAIPTLVMRGALDPLCSAAEARRVAEALGAHGALEVTLPDAGHLPFLQQPTRSLAAIEGVIMTAEAGG